MEEGTIRRADTRDADSLSACIDAAYAHYAERISDMPPVSEDCAEEIEKYLVWVAESDGRIIGGLILVPSDGFIKLANVAVHPDVKGAGMGKRLLTLAESEAIRRGYAEMRLNTHVDMPENVQLYSRNGWVLMGKKGNTITMRKQLLG